MSDLYCKLFVESSITRDELTREVASISDGSFERYTIVANWGEVDIRLNDEFDERKIDASDGFLFYRFANDIEPSSSVDRESYLAGVAKLVSCLRSRGYRVVPSCDFEDQINGGEAVR